MRNSASVDTSSVNPIIKKANWICAKLKQAGQKALLPEESVFIAELARRAFIQDDRVARRLVSEIQAAHLNYQLTLSVRP
jgi:hypothetical protein